MVDETSRIFGKKLTQLMREQELSLRKMEAKTGIPFNTINDYAHGRVAIPLNRARILAVVLGVSVDWMAGFTDERNLKKSVG